MIRWRIFDVKLDFIFSSVGFIQTNVIYMWKSTTFAIYKVTIPVTKLMVIMMTEFHLVNLAMVVTTVA